MIVIISVGKFLLWFNNLKNQSKNKIEEWMHLRVFNIMGGSELLHNRSGSLPTPVA
jgi:hypothetical protein